MRVIEENKIERKHKCSFCKSIIAYKYTDIYIGFWGTKYILCPVCKAEIEPSIFDRRVKNK